MAGCQLTCANMLHLLARSKESLEGMHSVNVQWSCTIQSASELLAGGCA